MTKTSYLANILIVDDEISIRRAFKAVLECEPYHVDEACDGIECLQMLEKKSFNIIFLDVRMPRKNGIECLEEIKTHYPHIPVVMISGVMDTQMAIECHRKGAKDVMLKPFDINHLHKLIRNAINHSLADISRKNGRNKSISTPNKHEIIGESEAVKHLKSIIEKAARFDKTDVLITGPNGSGKESVAQNIHRLSTRGHKPMIEVNCACITETLIEGILFGHVKGSFSDAKEDRKGKFEEAHESTLFLDEIGDMSLSAQASILRALETKTIVRLGGITPILVDVRIIAATNKNLIEEVKAGRFREDLFNRLDKLDIQVPPLNDRKEDIPILIKHFINLFFKNYQDIPEKTV